ncbi:hypothetical protein HDU67_007366 [Dinochytrium kinnereticum]|nr:hypothetical protein HDU67_007366 [Dinochytrium kinnereticum]
MGPTLMIISMQIGILLTASSFWRQGVRIAAILGSVFSTWAGVTLWHVLFVGRQSVSDTVGKLRDGKEEDGDSSKSPRNLSVTSLPTQQTVLSFLLLTLYLTLCVFMLQSLPTGTIQLARNSNVLLLLLNCAVPIAQMLIVSSSEAVKTKKNEWELYIGILSTLQFPVKFLRFLEPFQPHQVTFWLFITCQVLIERILPRAADFIVRIRKKSVKVAPSPLNDREEVEKTDAIMEFRARASTVQICVEIQPPSRPSPAHVSSSGCIRKERMDQDYSFPDSDIPLFTPLEGLEEVNESSPDTVEEECDSASVSLQSGARMKGHNTTIKDSTTFFKPLRKSHTQATTTSRSPTVFRRATMRTIQSRAITLVSRAVTSMSKAYSVGRNNTTLSNYISTLSGFACVLLPFPAMMSWYKKQSDNMEMEDLPTDVVVWTVNWMEAGTVASIFLAMEIVVEVFLVFVEARLLVPVGVIERPRMIGVYGLWCQIALNFICAYSGMTDLFAYG